MPGGRGAPARPAAPDGASAAYQRVAAELDALPAERVDRLGFEVSTAVSTVLDAAPQIAELRAFAGSTATPTRTPPRPSPTAGA